MMVRDIKHTGKKAQGPGKAASRNVKKVSKSGDDPGFTFTGKAGAKRKDSKGSDPEREPSSFYQEYKRKHGDLLTAMGKVD